VLKIPQSIAVEGATALSRSDATSILDYAADVPGLSVFDAGDNRKKIKIRGVSSDTESEPQETVGVYLDELNITNPGGTNNENGASPDLDLFDLNHIEVLKGPQGTLYGAGSMGGTVRYITNEPNLSRFEADVRATGSGTEHGAASYSGDVMINAPIVDDKLALRAVFSDAHVGGYIDNDANLTGVGYGPAGKVPGTNDFNSSNHWLGSLSLLYQATQALQFEIKYVHQTYDVNGTNRVTAGNYLTTTDYVVPFNKDQLDIVNGIIRYDTPIGLITSSTGYRKDYNLDRQDITPLLQEVFGTHDPAAQLYNDDNYHDISEELRLASHGNGPLKYVGGLYYSDLTKRFLQDAPYPGIDQFLGADVVNPIPSIVTSGTYPNLYQAVVNQNLRQFAAFGEITYSIAPIVDITLGGRYYDIKQNFDININPNSLFAAPGAYSRVGSLTDQGFTPKATISVKPSDDILVYFTAAKGFRPGGFNQPIPQTTGCAAELATLGISNSQPTFQADSLWSYELGGKAALDDNRLQITGSVYHIDWSQVQLEKQLSCGFTFFSNAGAAKINGLETNMTAVPIRNLKVGLSAAYTDAELAQNAPLFGVKGDNLPGIPRFTGSISGEYDFRVKSVDAYTGAELRYVGSFNSLADSTNPLNRHAGGYGIVDFHLGALLPHDMTAEIFAKNLFNRIATTGTYNSTFGDYDYRNRPREVGVQFEKHF
jgi:outer membrane receptor protein involved in Fe transport